MRRFFSVTAVLLVTALLVSPIGAQQKPLKRVSVQLGWIKNVQFGGLFVADQRGWFAQEGLDVTFIAGGAGIEPINSGASRSASARI
jgi:NitT/TauT family transport system substrate-binding protein